MNTREHYQGCLLGLACGDALCASYEGGPLERLLWSIIGRTRQRLYRFTDDTQMTLDIIEEFMARSQLEPDLLAQRFARSYRWSRGYGPGTARLLKQVRRGRHWSSLNRKQFKAGSFGNGAAMRAPALALIFRDDQLTLQQHCRALSVITHAHPAAIDGALCIAVTIQQILQGVDTVQAIHRSRDCLSDPSMTQAVDQVCACLQHSLLSPREIRRQLGHSVKASESCAAALYLAASRASLNFATLIQHCRQLGGDTDTIAAMAGAVWGAQHGIHAIDSDFYQQIEQADYLLDIAAALSQSVTQT